jgi:hypothetical protein
MDTILKNRVNKISSLRDFCVMQMCIFKKNITFVTGNDV